MRTRDDLLATIASVPTSGLVVSTNQNRAGGNESCVTLASSGLGVRGACLGRFCRLSVVR